MHKNEPCVILNASYKQEKFKNNSTPRDLQGENWYLFAVLQMMRHLETAMDIKEKYIQLTN
jgi:hypothetical protein